MGKIIILKTDGTDEQKTANESPTLEQLQEIVDGYIELVNVFFGGKYEQMIVNEEGRLNGLPFNYRATSVYHCNYITHKGEVPYDPIVGNAVILTGNCKLD